MTRFILFLVFAFLSVGLAESAAPAGDIAKGEKSYKSRGCSICHSIRGEGGRVGPDLTQVTIRRSEERIFNWLKDPASFLKDTDMPKAPWASDEEVKDVIAYLKSVRREIKKDYLGKVSVKETGRRLTEEYDCKSCHRITDPDSGNSRYPDLTAEGKRRTKKWLKTWLKDPQKIKPGTFMPTYPLTDDEIEAIAEYISGLK